MTPSATEPTGASGSATGASVVEVLAVYAADGGLRGEAAYLVGKLLRRAHCSLCDITHSPVRRRAEWDRLLREFPLPIRVVHRNELTPKERAAVGGRTLPIVLGRLDGGGWRELVDAPQLERADGSVAAFAELLRAAARPPRADERDHGCTGEPHEGPVVGTLGGSADPPALERREEHEVTDESSAPLRDDDMTTTGLTGAGPTGSVGDADGVDATVGDADGTDAGGDADGTDAGGDADGTDAGGDADGTDS